MFIMFYSSVLFLVFATSPFFAQAAAQCNRFSTNGSTAATYDFHRFYDFRQLHEIANVDAASASSYGEGHSITESASGQSKIIQAAPWVSGWNARDWYRPSPREDTVDMYYKPSRVSISKLESLSFCFYRSLTTHRQKQRRVARTLYLSYLTHEKTLGWKSGGR